MTPSTLTPFGGDLKSHNITPCAIYSPGIRDKAAITGREQKLPPKDELDPCAENSTAISSSPGCHMPTSIPVTHPDIV
ncbi:hypothetical protein Aduo_001726 [Ancylostoma duodenale]